MVLIQSPRASPLTSIGRPKSVKIGPSTSRARAEAHVATPRMMPKLPRLVNCFGDMTFRNAYHGEASRHAAYLDLLDFFHVLQVNDRQSIGRPVADERDLGIAPELDPIRVFANLYGAEKLVIGQLIDRDVSRQRRR